MCGITGLAVKGVPDASEIVAACSTILHRGPDDAGVKVWSDQGVGLGHRRLSIIDLSPSGRQPMCNEDETVWIVFNGEIYNYQELRLELTRSGHTFHSNTDTEVIIHAYEQWGDKHVHRLRGMFAYTIYDRRLRKAGDSGRQLTSGGRLLLVRDRLGIKPLFYSWDKQLFIFASEIKAILAYPGVDRTIDRSAIFDYLTYLYIPAPKTAYSHIRKLPPGHLLVLENGNIKIHQYWDVPPERYNPVRTFHKAVEMVRETLCEAVRLHMVSDVPIGVLLSGGMDSSTITALMAQVATESVRTFSIGFDVPEHSETHYARLVADRYQTQHYERVVGVDSVKQMLPRVLQMYDEPYADGSAVPTYQVSSMAREHVKVVLSGDGGDEVFAGYRWYTAWLKRQAFNGFPLPLRHRLFSFLGTIWPDGWRGKGFLSDLALGSLEQYARFLELFSPSEKRQILTPELSREFADYDDYWYFRQYWRNELDPLTRVQYLDLKTYLHEDILTKIDRASMTVSLEVRPPLLDHVLVERVLSVSSQFRAPGGQKKYLLKKAVRDLLPEPVLTRPKKGFSAPWTKWVSTEKEWVELMLKSNNYPPRILREDAGEMRWLFGSGAKIWALLVLQGWLRKELMGG